MATSGKEIESEDRARIIRLLREEYTQRQVAAMAHVSINTVAKVAKELRDGTR